MARAGLRRGLAAAFVASSFVLRAGNASAEPQAAAEPAETSAPAPAPAPAPAKTDEVRVTGVRAPRPAKTTIGGAEVRQVPGAFGDTFRVLETLPGVTPLVSGLPFFFVRGAPPGNSGYYLDGVRVPLLYHIGLGPSVIHPGLVQTVDFYPGGYPARYGRFVGGILAGTTRPPAETLHGEGNIRLFDAGALVESPFAGGRGTALVSGRYSYTAAIVSLAAPGIRLDYWDYQARVTYALGPKDTIGVFAFGSYDYLANRETRRDPITREERQSTRTLFATQFHRIDLRWDHALPDNGKLRVAATIGSDATSTEELTGVRDRMIATRLNLEQPLSKAVLVRAGTDATLDHYDIGEGEATGLYPPRNDIAVGAYLDAVLRPTSAWEVTPGIRLDYFGSVRALGASDPFDRRNGGNAAVPAVDPRLSSRLALAKPVTWISTFAVTHQTPSFFLPVPGLQLGRLAGGLQTGVQASQGLELKLPLGITATPTAFYHYYTGLNDFTTTCGDISDQDDQDCVDRRVRGRTFGAELLVKRSLTERLTGWVSYTLSRTTRTTQVNVLGHRGDYTEIPSDFDRTHVLNVIGAYDLGANWRAGLRFFFYSGRPYSQRLFNYPVPPYNDERMPPFWRFDARLEKAWRIGEKGRVAIVFEWMNFTLNKEVSSVQCARRPGASRSVVDVEKAVQGSIPPELLDDCGFQEIGPITIPSVGVEGSF